MPAGFLYILINPSMPGLTKVGKTTRNPTNRVAELSSATGVPSPFILAYQQPVAECDSAELWVHKELEREGFRHANNREFFNAPLHEIIQIVSRAADFVFDSGASNETGVELVDNETSVEDLAEELYDLGCAYQDGTDSVLRNNKKALEYFEQAAALGNTTACTSAATIYQFGDGVPQDMEKALALLSRSVYLGAWWSEASIAGIFLESKQENAAKTHWNLFFERACEEADCTPEMSSIIGGWGSSYCQSVAAGKLEHCVPDQALARLAEPILKSISDSFTYWANHSDKELSRVLTELLRKVRLFVEKIKSTGIEKASSISTVQPTSNWSFKNIFK